MSVVVRRVRATPQRGASDAWHVIVDLVAPHDGEARRELLSIDGIAASIIATESPRDAPIIVCGNGPRARLYCLYGDEAVAGDDANETPLGDCPTDGNWTMSLPVEADDLDWVKSSLAKKSSRVTAREKSEAFKDDEQKSKQADVAASINMEAFLRS